MDFNAYQRLAMRTANTNPAATTPEDKLLNAVLGIIGESGEIAVCGILSSPFASGVLAAAQANGAIADAIKKHYYHGHPIDARALGERLAEIDASAKRMSLNLNKDVGASQARLMSHPMKRDELTDELGDLLWYITLAADALGISLEEIAQRNVEKLRRRYPDGFDAERSRNRS